MVEPLANSQALTTEASHVVALDIPVVRAGLLEQAAAAAGGRRLVLMTPPTSVMTWTAWRDMHQEGRSWVVEQDGDFWDGLTGHTLAWVTDRFVDTGQPSPRAFAAWEGARLVHLVEAEVVHPLTAKLVGTLIDPIANTLALQLHVGEVADKSANPLDASHLTRAAQHVAPDALRLPIHATYASGEIEVDPEPAGVVERVAIVAGHLPGNGLGLANEMVRLGAQVATCVARPGDEWGRLLPSAPLPEPLGISVSRSRVPTISTNSWERLPGATANPMGLSWVHPPQMALVDVATTYAEAYQLIAESDFWPPTRDERHRQFS